MASNQMNKHITEILDRASIAALSESDLNEVRAHVLECMACRDAYEAARLSAVVIQNRAQVVNEPSQTTPAIDQTASAYSEYSVIMDQGADDQMSYEQVLSTIYDDDDEAR